jgi:hypothetical protein
MMIQQLLTKEHAQHWKQFVAEYMVLVTKSKANRALVREYSVKKVGERYCIYFGKTTSYLPMDADTLYGWTQRLPLKYFADEADNLRYDIMVSN